MLIYSDILFSLKGVLHVVYRGVKCHVWHGRSSLLSLVYLFAGLLFLVDVFTYIKNKIYIYFVGKKANIFITDYVY